MSRPHTEFLQAQWLPWQSDTLLPHLSGVAHRVLSHDDKTGAMSALLRFPPGWVANELPPCTLHEEIYTLDGALGVNEVFFAADFYGFLPAGFPRHRATAPQGAVALAFYTPAAKPSDGYDHARWVPRTDVFSAIWPAAEPHHGLDLAAHQARARVLWSDPNSGAQTIIVGYPPVWQAATIETQTVDAEYYVLAGECTVSGRGTMTPGAYIWRPKGAPRVPMAARTGTVFLIRSHGGPLAFTATGEGTVKPADDPACIIPPDTAARLSGGPYAKEAA
ncbi:MAG: DUF4437 domain-containing protein [Proteobacteria bacterium]|nr:DUF4437 domain-containing protein [Pseudomonadota bacterium]MDA1059413.1 DUF4437 domain-containing protein [Pseudomonadota bacterium]